MKVAAAFILMGILPIGAVAAELPSSVLAAYGIAGRWSVACDQPVGPHNPRFSFEIRPDGLVDSVGDYGEDGPSRATVREAFVDGEHRLHTMSYATFEGLPKQMRDALAKSGGGRPGITTRSIFAMEADGGLVTQDVIFEIDGLPMPLHTVSDGRARMVPQTSAPGIPVPTRYRCSP